MSRELIRRGLRRWRGVGGDDGAPVAPADLFPALDDDGSPLLDGDGEPVMRSGLDLFIADPRTFEAADRAYVIPWLNRDREGNVSSASPNGTGEAGTPGPATASTPATGEPTGDVVPMPPAKAAAPTSGTRRGRKKA